MIQLRRSAFHSHSIFLLVIFLLLSSHSSFSQIEKKRSVNLGLVYPISNHGTRALAYSNIFSLHALGGLSGEERGFTAAGISNVIHHNARGFQVAGISNHIGRNTAGFQAAGLINTYDSSRGLQVAGLINHASGSVQGAQFAGLLNTAHDVEGWQLAGLLNTADDVRGVQGAGLLNIAHKVTGVQLVGLLNVADSSDYPVALINIIKNGERRISLSTDETLTTLASFRSGS